MMKAELVEFMGSDLTVVNAARVSMDKHHSRFTDGDAKLIAYLAAHEHWTPFAHPQATFRITAPIFVANQLKRHQIGFALNEVSRRYVDSEPTFEALVWRARPASNIKQGSGGELPAVDQAVLAEIQKLAEERAVKSYRILLDKGVAPEQARAVLPQSMHTSWYWTGSLYAWARLCRQRLDSHAQGETRQVAELIAEEMGTFFPVSWKALMNPHETFPKVTPGEFVKQAGSLPKAIVKLILEPGGRAALAEAVELTRT